MSKYPPVHYHDYLQIDQLLSCQSRKSVKHGKPAHDEMLFIIVHQIYELWFKQILTELDSILEIFKKQKVDERDMGSIVSRLARVVEIQKHLIDQIRIMETMTPLDFLDFRDMLFPASGFQSFQFRALENKLGLNAESRLKYNAHTYHSSLTPEQSANAKQMESEPSLFDGVEKWLERTPFLNLDGFNFWQTYRQAVLEMFAGDAQIVKDNTQLGDADKKRNLEILAVAEKSFESLFDERAFEQARKQGHWRMSYRALQGALLIQIYRDQPALQLPFRLITCLLDIDELMTNWRYRHALMAKRMLGSKIGTGGSSGYEYLKATTEQHKIFQDLFQLTTFFIPRSSLPILPKQLEKRLGFSFEQNSANG